MGYLESIDRLEGSTRASTASKHPWHAAYREIARITYGLLPEDPRLKTVLAAIDRCDEAFTRGDWSTFQKSLATVRTSVGYHGRA
jgi:hypothetical protein